MAPQFLIASAAATLLSVSLAAHGGAYNPPPLPDVPIGKVGLPNPSQPPSIGGSPVHPGTPQAGPATPGSMPSVFQLGVDQTRWSWWWEFQKAPYLDLKRHVLSEDPLTGPRLPGDGPPQASPALVPSPATLRAQALRPLLAVLDQERDADLLSSAIIAAARIADDLDPSDQQAVADAVRPFVRDATREVSEASVLALGILGHEPSAPHLAALLQDSPLGRSLFGQPRVPTRLRAMAAFALGLLGNGSGREDVRRYIVHELTVCLKRERASARSDLEAACVLAFGLVPLRSLPVSLDTQSPQPASSSRAAQLLLLESLLADKDRQIYVRAQVPLSMARLCAEPGPGTDELRVHTAKILIARLAPMRREPNPLIQSVVVALGQLADNDDDPADREVRRVLLGLDSDHKDAGARHFARIALARIAARDGAGDPKGLVVVRQALLKELSRGNSTERPWAALALGVLERGRIDLGYLPDADIASAMRDAFTSARSPDEIGACAVALGLMRDPAARTVLLDRIGGTRDDEARGQLCLALGMIGAREAVPRLNQIVDNSTYRPLLLRSAVAGLALLSSKEVVPRLLDHLVETRASASRAAIARAIGLIGDSRALAPLAAMVQDKSLTKDARAFGAVALGLCGDLDPLPWNTPLAINGNHLAAPTTLYDELGLGVLNVF